MLADLSGLFNVVLGIALVAAGGFIALLVVDNHQLAVENDKLRLDNERKNS